MRPSLILRIALTLSLLSASASATVVERVVAVVGERAILLSDLRERARPMLLRIYDEIKDKSKRSAAISQTYKSVLEHMVDEELQQRAANRARIVVNAREVDNAIGRIAVQNGLSVEQLVREAKRAGLTERQYRTEIRRQVLDAKLVNLRLQGRIRITNEDLKNAYRRLILSERRRQFFRAAWIRVDIPAGTKGGAAQRLAFAEDLARRARGGEDFALLARKHSNDTASAQRGGLLGRLRPGRLPRKIDTIALRLNVGEVSAPVRAGNAFYVVKMIERDESSLPSYSEARDQLSNRIYLEKMSKARRHWLDSLRRRTHVEVRL